MMNRRRTVVTLLAAASWAGKAKALDYPTRPVTILVPFPAGGPGDLMARSIGDVMRERMGQPVIVDARPGGGGQIAASALLQAPANGHTLMLGEMSTLCSNKLLYTNFRYDPLVDFEPIATLLQMPMVLYVPKNSPFNSLADLVNASKSRPLNYASQGGGTAGHFLGEMLASATGGKLNHVPYKGSGPAMTDVMGGQVDMLFDGIGAGLQYLAGQKLKTIAVAGPTRLSQIPDVPTTAEGGVPDVSLSVWFGVVARAGTPADIVRRLNEEITYALKQPVNVKRFGDLGFQFMSMTPEEFRGFMRRETDRWGAFIKARHIVLN